MLAGHLNRLVEILGNKECGDIRGHVVFATVQLQLSDYTAAELS